MCAIEGKSDALYVSYDDAPWTVASGDDPAAINTPHASVAAIGDWVFFFLNIIFFFLFMRMCFEYSFSIFRKKEQKDREK